MDSDTYQIISIIGFSLAGISLIIAVVLFFILHIPSLIGILTGKTAEKQIKELHEQNMKTGKKSYRLNSINAERSALTERIGKSTQLNNKIKTNELSTSKSLFNKGSNQQFSDATDVLASEDTEVLSMFSTAETEVLAPETEVLSNSEATTILTPTDELNTSEVYQSVAVFRVIKSVISINTDEVIP